MRASALESISFDEHPNQINMKKLLFLCGIIAFAISHFVFTSCNNEDSSFSGPFETLDSPHNYETHHDAKQDNSLKKKYSVSPEDAEKMAACLRPNKNYKLEPYVVENDTLLYIVNFDEGWIILAGDKRVNPLVAESDKEYLSLQTPNENLLTWIDSYADEIRVYKFKSEETENDFSKLWSKVSPDRKDRKDQTRSSQEYKWAVVSYTYCDYETYIEEIPHLVSTKWGQESPWNTKLPNDISAGNRKCPTGCTAVGIAQIIYYMHYFLGKPTGLFHNISIGSTTIHGETQNIGFSRSNYDNNSPRWDEMALTQYSIGNKIYVGDLMLDIGNLLNTRYSGTGSTAAISQSVMAYYNLSYSQSSFNYQTVKNDLQNSKPLNVGAKHRIDGTNSMGAHFWIIDGICKKIRHYVTSKHFEYTENWMYESEYYNTFDELRERYHINSEFDFIEEDGGFSVSDYLLMNWGYDGDLDDGYYSTYPSTAWTIDDNNYNYDKKIYYNYR